jgi:hypothetical protein
MPAEGHGQMSELMRTMAVYYADLGLRVVPLHGVDDRACTCRNPACKSPAKHPRTINGLKDGSVDRDTVVRMWTRWPFASIGICTGIDSGVLVIDVDDMTQVPELLRDWVLAEYPPTWRATTGRGGKHVFFRYQSDQVGIRSRTGVWPKVDVRADGGYVVAAPSPHISGHQYAWDVGCSPADAELASLPSEIELILRAGGAGALVDQPQFLGSSLPGHPGQRTTGASGPPPTAGHLAIAADDVARIKAALAYVDATPRDTWLRVGMALKSTSAGQQAYDIWTEWSQTAPSKFDPVDQAKTWRGLRELLPHGVEVSIATVFHLARQAGAPDLSTIGIGTVILPSDGSGAPLIGAPAIVEAPDHPAPDEPVENLPGEGAEPVPTTEVEPFPESIWTRLRARSELIHDMVQWIVETAPRRQPVLALGNTLAALGALLGRRVRSPSNTRTNLYVFGIAGSGRGKEHSRQCMTSLFVRANLGAWIGADKWKSDSGLRAELLKAPAHLAQVDEFGKVLRQVASPYAPSHLAGIVTALLELHGRANGVDLGPAYADQKARPREVIVEPCLAVYATSVPDDLFAALTSKDVADGFLNRWVCLFGDERPQASGAEDSSYQPPAHLVAALQLLEKSWQTEQTPGDGYRPQVNIPSMCPTVHVVPRTPDASARRHELVARIEADRCRKEDAGDSLAALWTRVPETVERVALILAATRPVRFELRDGKSVPRWDGVPARREHKDRDGFAVPASVPTSIEREDFDLAYEMVSWAFRRFELECGRRIADNEYEARLKKVLRILIAAGTKGLTHNTLTRKAQWLSAREREDVMKTLAESGQCVATMVARPSGQPGRPGMLYRFAGFCGPGATNTSITSRKRQPALVALSVEPDSA